MFLYYMSLETRRLFLSLSQTPFALFNMPSLSPLLAKAKRRLEMDPVAVAAGSKRRRLSSTTSNEEGRKRTRTHFHMTPY